MVIVAKNNIARIDLASGTVLQQMPLASSFEPPILQTSRHRLVVRAGDLLETIDLVTGRNTILNQLPAGSSCRFAGSLKWADQSLLGQFS